MLGARAISYAPVTAAWTGVHPWQGRWRGRWAASGGGECTGIRQWLDHYVCCPRLTATYATMCPPSAHLFAGIRSMLTLPSRPP